MPERTEPVFDRQAALQRFMNDEELLAELAAEFLKELPPQLDELEDALNAQDVARAADLAHGIKGAAANMATEALRAAAWEMEKAARAGHLGDATSLLAALRHEFERTRTALSQAS